MPSNFHSTVLYLMRPIGGRKYLGGRKGAIMTFDFSVEIHIPQTSTKRINSNNNENNKDTKNDGNNNERS